MAFHVQVLYYLTSSAGHSYQILSGEGQVLLHIIYPH